MQIEVLADADAVAARAAEIIAEQARTAVRERGRFCIAVSGGRTPWRMLHLLAAEDVPWARVHLFQVDERVAPDGDDARNLTHIAASLLRHVPLPAAQVHAMDVVAADLDAAARHYARTLADHAGTPPTLDLVHLGLGPDGHTASLVPGDAALHVTDAEVALTAPYLGHRRMTMTYPVLNRARAVLWLATGAEKRAMLARLLAHDTTIPAGRVDARRALALADEAAAG